MLRLHLVPLAIRKGMTTAVRPVEEGIRSKLMQALAPTHLDVINESYMHNVPEGSETHFKVVVVSDKFEGLPLLKRHRLVNGALREELRGPVHALAVSAHSPRQWDACGAGGRGGAAAPSPACRGGFGK